MSAETRPPLPPFTRETAVQKVRAAEDGWNSRDPAKVSLAYTTDSHWRNRAEFLTRNFNRQIHGALVPNINNHWIRLAIAGEKMRDHFNRLLCGRKSDALKRFLDDGFQAFQRQSEMGAAFGRDERVNFINDDGVDSTESLCCLRGEHEIERFRRGDENVSRMTAKFFGVEETQVR